MASGNTADATPPSVSMTPPSTTCATCCPSRTSARATAARLAYARRAATVAAPRLARPRRGRRRVAASSARSSFSSRPRFDFQSSPFYANFAYSRCNMPTRSGQRACFLPRNPETIKFTRISMSSPSKDILVRLIPWRQPRSL